VALAVVWSDFGDGRSASGAASLADTLVLPSAANAVLYLLLAGIHKAASSVVSVGLTGETVDTISAFDNLSGDAAGSNLGAFAVRNPASGSKTLTYADDALLRSFAWAGWLVTGVPASGYTDDIYHPAPASSGSVASNTLNLTSTKPNGLLLGLFGWRGNDKGPFGLSAGWTEDADQSPGASVTTDVAYHAVRRTAPTAGAYSATSTPTVSARQGVIAISVLPSLVRRPQIWS
jgi:hypothetical protein